MKIYSMIKCIKRFSNIGNMCIFASNLSDASNALNAKVHQNVDKSLFSSIEAFRKMLASAIFLDLQY